MFLDQDVLVSLYVKGFAFTQLQLYVCSNLMVWHPCSHIEDYAALVKSLLYQVPLQNPQWFPLVALPFLHQFSCSLIFIGSYPERYVFHVVIVISSKFFILLFIDCLRPSIIGVRLCYPPHITRWYIVFH